jgi:hypothetical protein
MLGSVKVLGLQHIKISANLDEWFLRYRVTKIDKKVKIAF